ncbi:MAG: hypothetical protein LBJ24_08770 [Treponema sp.]|jgi:hypothetical protein|nr:hypothetical protein [Treponema sp.]
MHQKQAAAREYLSRYQKAAKKEKPSIPGGFVRLTGCGRLEKQALLSAVYTPLIPPLNFFMPAPAGSTAVYTFFVTSSK